MAKLGVAFRLLRERLRRGKKATLRSVQARRLFWPALAGEKQVLFDWRNRRKLACIGGLAESLNECNQPALALMRELHEELGLGPRLCTADERQFCFHHDFVLQSGESVRFTEDSWIHIGEIYRLRCDQRAPIHGMLPFGMHVACYPYEVYVYAQAPPQAQRIDGSLPFSAPSAWSIRGKSGEITAVLASPLDPDGSTLHLSTERDWRMPPERYITVPPVIPGHYFVAVEHADGSSGFPDGDPEAKFFIDGDFYPFGRIVLRMVSAVVLAGMLAALSVFVYTRL